MLKLTRRPGETLVLQTEHEEIRIHFKLHHQQIKLGIVAPSSVVILRGELLDRSPAHQNNLKNNDADI